MKLSFRRFLARLWARFPASALLCVLITGTTVLMDWQPAEWKDSAELLSQITNAFTCGLCLSALGSLLSRRNRWPGWLCWCFAAVGVALGAILWSANQLAFWGVCAAVTALCFHIASGRERRAERLGQIAGCFFGSAGLALCLCLALQLCFYAVGQLFFTGSWRVTDRLSTLAMELSLLLAAPWLFLGRLPDEDDPPQERSGYRKVAANLFLPAYLLLLAILLCYILMILFRWEMPVGQMNGLALTALSLFAVFRLSLTGEENGVTRWFFRWGAWLMLPVLAVQQVGVWMRYTAYGLTPSRYAGMVITLLLALTVIWSLLRKRADWFFIGAAAVALVLTVTPLNADEVSRLNQEARLRNALVASGMLDETDGTIIPNPEAEPAQQEVILSAANYLRSLNGAPEGSFTQQLQQQMRVDGETVPNLQLFGFQTQGQSSRKTRTFYGSSTDESVEVAGFSHADWYNYKYVLAEGEVAETPPLLPAETLMAYADFASETLLTEDILLPDGRTLRLCTLVLTERNGEPESLRVQGWLLTP